MPDSSPVSSKHDTETQHPLLRGLNPVQREAVQYGDGPLLLFAGAGSGKTRVLTHRVAYLIASKGVSPRHILAVTFTNKAAQEMKERIGKLVGENVGKHLWIGTFHAVCARLLREYGDKIGLKRDFVVYDDSDQLTIVRECLRQLNLDDKKFPPRTVLSRISKAKEKMISPQEWHKNFVGFFEDICGKVYPLYQEKLRQNNALDFDDLLMETVRLFDSQPEILDRLQDRFRYILVDEYQDVNHVQYMFLNKLANKYQNLTIVGDDDQCLPSGTLIRTMEGCKPIETVRVGDTVFGTGGSSTLIPGRVAHVHKGRYEGDLYTIRAGENVLRGTPHHIVLGRLEALPERYYVYLMYRADRGYRIGVTKCSQRGWTAGVAHDQHGFIVRSNQEHADKLWILKITDSFSEARFWEEFYSAKYGIPTMVFHVIGRNMPVDEAWIKRLYAALDTEVAARRLMSDLDMHPNFPHYRPQNGTRRQTLNLVMFGGFRTSRRMALGEHRIQWCSNRAEIADRLKAEGYSIRPGKLGGFRLETCRSSYHEAVCLVKEIAQAGGLDIQYRAKVDGQIYAFLPLSHLHQGMRVLVHSEEGKLVEAEVEEVTRESYSGDVYDLEVDRTHTYLAGDLLVHNSIYQFRGADVGLILQFEKDYPHAKVLKLEQNYRSTKTILEAAYGVVRHNRGRKDKKLWTENEVGIPLTLREAENEQEEAVWLVRKIRDEVLKPGGRKWSDFAILYRTNAQSRILEEVFLTFNSPYKIVGGVRFYERKEIKDVMAYLRVLHNPADSISLRRILNVPVRGIGATTLAALDEEMQMSGHSLWAVLQDVDTLSQVQPRTRVKLAEFTSLIASLRAEKENLTVTDLTQRVLERSGYQRALEEESTIEAQTRLENVKELLSVTKEFEATAETSTLGAFLEQVSLVSDIDSLDQSADAVTMMTLHSAKGLEFPVVFLVGMEECVFPHLRSMESDRELEEERRLCYVGITRAREELYLSCAARRSLFGSIAYNPPSRFLKEIPQDLFQSEYGGRGPAVSSFDPDADERQGRQPAKEKKLWVSAPDVPGRVQAANNSGFKVGQKVRHATFGMGVVLKVSGEGENTTVEVVFPNVGPKKLVLAYARLEKVK
ncbi:MAG TPA: UvrD-helicase domain-containing protein [Chthonomonadaceae bacterium]|nr:UvrD-helicase domain-containing protein [Chthonomonadaceae bacterium]